MAEHGARTSSPPAGTRLRCATASTWDGGDARADEVAHLALDVAEDGVRLRVEAPWHRDPPPTLPRGRHPSLWEHEVVECMFLGSQARYTEVELGPHGHWLALRLHGVRNVVDTDLRIEPHTRFTDAGWSSDLWIPASLLPRDWCRLNAFAMHGCGPDRRWLAWRPPGGPRPDFHRLEVFAAWEEARERAED